jgi:hypothetical protein
MNTHEHASVHDAHMTPHVKYWGSVKAKAEECVKHVLEGGDTHVTLHEAIGKSTIGYPEDWDVLMEFCHDNGAHCHDMNRLYRAQVAWIQAYNELEYKKTYP